MVVNWDEVASIIRRAITHRSQASVGGAYLMSKHEELAISAALALDPKRYKQLHAEIRAAAHPLAWLPGDDDE